MKKEYLSPKIDLTVISCDIITYSETEEWEGPVISAGQNEEDQ